MKLNSICFFSASSVGFSPEFSVEKYLSRINWLRASGRYIVVDPNNSELLIYLREKEYNRLVISSIANDISIIVIATPDDSKDTINKRFPDSTTPNIEFLVSRITKLVSLIPGWELTDSMIYFQRNFINKLSYNKRIDILHKFLNKTIDQTWC